MIDLVPIFVFPLLFQKCRIDPMLNLFGPPRISIKSAGFGGTLSSWENIDSLNLTLEHYYFKTNEFCFTKLCAIPSLQIQRKNKTF
jgi:hypothetical protein